ncbi:peptidoglycan-binding protein [Actinoplanes sp. NPDC049548]|uniref:peptidoglycan-binding protein n=1 Tax=Actinoplanes sp. NPDC049548 TaxID=3155152 RepID=UPI0034131DF0
MSTTQTPVEGVGTGAPETNGRRPVRTRRRRGPLILVVVLSLVAAATVAYVVFDPFGSRRTDTTIDSGSGTALAQVTKGSLSARSAESGTLGFAGTYTLLNKVAGTYTKLPAVGDVIKSGKALYKVDGEPVLLLKGAWVPVYRKLEWGDEGADVRQLNQALVDLGYASSAKLDRTSNEFGYQTYKALRKLQDAIGQDKTGELDLGQVIFVPVDRIRVTEVSGKVGGAATSGQQMLTASSTNRQVSVALRATRQSNVKVGDQVVITLPSNKTTPGKVASVGTVATKDDDGNITVPVLITPLKPKDTGNLDKAPVQVAIVSETVKNVLTVPVNALLALAGGGYAVEVVDAAGAHRLVAVKTGLFDDDAGRVEVSGTGLVQGQNVVVPAS